MFHQYFQGENLKKYIIPKHTKRIPKTPGTFLSILVACPVAPFFSLCKWPKFESAIKHMFDRPVCGMSGIAKACKIDCDEEKWLSSLVGTYGHAAFQYSRACFSWQ